MAARAVAVLAALLLSMAAAACAAPLRVVVISDLNGSYGSVRYDASIPAAVARIVAMRPDLVISTGDMVAGQRRPHLSDGELRAMWSAFHKAVTDPLHDAGIPLAVTPGNHDASAYAGFARERAIFAEEWAARHPDLHLLPGGDYPFRYAFDLGPARFVAMDVTTVGTLDAGQMRWMDETFDGSPPALVAFSHLPLWPFAQGRETEVIADPDLKRLFVENRVDLYLSGHHHAFYPGNAEGLALVSQACLGSGPRKLIGETRRSARAITVLEISETGDIAVMALTGPAFSEALEIEELPRSIGSGKQSMERLDLAPTSAVAWGTTTMPDAK